MFCRVIGQMISINAFLVEVYRAHLTISQTLNDLFVCTKYISVQITCFKNMNFIRQRD